MLSPNQTPLEAEATTVESLLENQKDIVGLYKRYEFDEMKDILHGFLKPAEEDGGKETAKVESQGKVDINKKLDNLFD